VQPAYLNPRERVQRLSCVFKSGVGVLPLQEPAHTVDFGKHLRGRETIILLLKITLYSDAAHQHYYVKRRGVGDGERKEKEECHQHAISYLVVDEYA